MIFDILFILADQPAFLFGVSFWSPHFTYRAPPVSNQHLSTKALVVEKADTLLDKSNVKLLSRVKHSRVVLATGRSSNVLYSGPSCSVDVVDEWELHMSVGC